MIVEKGREIVSTPAGEIYVRASAQKLPLKPESYDEVELLKLDKGLATFEDTVLADASEATISDSYTVTEFTISAVPVSAPKPWLESQLAALTR